MSDQVQPRELLSFEERSRILSEVIPALVGEGGSPCGRVRAFVGHESALLRLEWNWDDLRAQLASKRGEFNSLIGAAELASLTEFAVVTAVNHRQVLVTDAFHVPAPSRTTLAEGFRDEYWSLPEHLRPDTEDEYVKQQLMPHGPKIDPHDQVQADLAQAAARLDEFLVDLETDPKKIRASEVGVTLLPGLAEAKEKTAALVERLAKIDKATVRCEGKDDEHNPSVIVTASYESPFSLWLHPEIFTRVGSKLDKTIVECAAKAKAKLIGLVRGTEEE